jgi:hypothetical protein
MKKYHLVVVLSIVILGLFLFQCAEEPQKSLYNLEPNYPVKPDPTVERVEPASAYAGITEVTVYGTNFDPSDNYSHTRVYFGGKKAEILSVTTTEIHCIAPVIAGDSLIVKVQVDGAMLFGESQPYRVEYAQQDGYGGITGAFDAYGLAVDLSENLYASLGEGKIIKVTPEEEQQDFVIVKPGQAFKTMKMGPGGVLYAGRTIYMYQFTESTTDSIRLTRPINDFDFDENLNIYYSTKFAIYGIDQNGNQRVVADYPDYLVNSLRVYDGYVYISGKYNVTPGSPDSVKAGVWRNPILNSSGDLGAKELVFDWYNYYPSGTIGIPEILAITFAEDGDLYIGADSTDISDAITVVTPDGNGQYLPENASPLYPAVLLPPATNFVWGNGQYLYVNRRSLSTDYRTVVRVTMGKNSAPYYGRQP